MKKVLVAGLIAMSLIGCAYATSNTVHKLKSIYLDSSTHQPVIAASVAHQA